MIERVARGLYLSATIPPCSRICAPEFGSVTGAPVIVLVWVQGEGALVMFRRRDLRHKFRLYIRGGEVWKMDINKFLQRTRILPPAWFTAQVT